MFCYLDGTMCLDGCFPLIYCGRGFPFVFREKPFGRAYNWANFANVTREHKPKGNPERGGHRLPHKNKEREKAKNTKLAPKKLESSYKHLKKERL